MKSPLFFGAVLLALCAAGTGVSAACRTDLPAVTRISREVPTGVSAGDAGDLIWSDDCARIYIANRARNRIEVFSLAGQSWEAPINAGNAPRGMDTSIDGRLLYVANNGEMSVSEINLLTRAERRIAVTSGGLPQDLVVAANGKVLVFTAGGTLVKVDPSSGVESAIGVGELFGRTGDRRLVVASRRQTPTYRYWSDSDSISPVNVLSGHILSQTGQVGIGSDNRVRDMRSGSTKLLGEIPRHLRATRGLMVDHAGRYAYEINNTANTSDPAAIDTIDLNTFQRVRRTETDVAMEVPPGPETYYGVSPDDGLVAFVGGNILVIVRTDPAPLANKVSVFSLRFANLYSLLRFHNQGAQAGRARVTLQNYDTGEVMHTWTSPLIAPGSAPQFYVRDMELSSGRPFVRPFKYIATFETDFPGTAAHVTWYPGGPISDASTCATGVMGPSRSLANVHSSQIGDDYPSEIGVMNTGSSAAPFTLGVYSAHSGAFVARYNGGDLPAGGSRTIAMTEIERAAGLAPGQDLTHYVVTLEGPMSGTLHHLVYHRPSGVLSDMSTVCALPAK